MFETINKAVLGKIIVEFSKCQDRYFVGVYKRFPFKLVSHEFFKGDTPTGSALERATRRFEATLANVRGDVAWKAEKRAKKQAARKAAREEGKAAYLLDPLFTVGTLISYSWGYDQTNVEFFQVVKATGMRVTLRAIAGESVPDSGGFLCDRVRPLKDNFLDGEPEITKTVQVDHGRGVLVFPHGTGSVVAEGETEHRSWSH